MKEKIMFDELVNDIVTRIDPAGHNTDGLTKHYRLKLSMLVNQEVERRIKERMSDDEIKSIALRYAPIMMYAGITCMEDVNLSIRQDVIEMLVNLRSRLTNPGDSQKTEGGGE